MTNKKLYVGTLNKLDYVAVKLDNMIHDFYVNDIVNPRFTPTLEAVKSLADDLSIIADMVHAGARPNWEIVKKYCSIADEFRTIKAA